MFIARMGSGLIVFGQKVETSALPAVLLSPDGPQ